MKIKVKMDFNRLVEQIGEKLEKSQSEESSTLDFAIEIGVNLLCSYMTDFAQYAIDTNDEYLINLCKSLSIIEETEDAE